MIERGEYISDIRIRREAEALVEAGHSVHIACSGQYDSDRHTELNGVQISRICSRNKLTHNTFEAVNKLTFYQPYWVYKIKSIIEDGDFDILYYHDIPPGKFATRLAQHYNLSIVVDLHEMYPQAIKLWLKAYSFRERLHPKRLFDPPWRYQRLERFVIDHADALVTVSEEMKEYFIERYNYEGLSGVVKNVPDLERLDQMTIKNLGYSSDFVISYIGGFTPQRGIERIIEAMPRIIKEIPNVKLVLVGDGAESYIKNLKSRCDELKISDHVVFEGWVDFELIRSYYEISSVTVIPYYNHKASQFALPNKLFQAMAFRTPIIASDLPSMKRIIEDSGAGLTVSDTSSLAETIVEISKDRTLLDNLGESGRKMVEDRYNIDMEIEVLLNIFEDLS
jgi:glycosyltransferase involved in cell wall biosynthesis